MHIWTDESKAVKDPNFSPVFVSEYFWCCGFIPKAHYKSLGSKQRDGAMKTQWTFLFLNLGHLLNIEALVV